MRSRLPLASLARLALTLSLVCVLPARAAAWGSAGHRIVARVAAANLTPAAESAVRGLLGKDDLAAVSTYADEVRAFRPETTAWHFVEMPRDAKAYVPSRDCVYTSRGDCAVAAIQRLEKILRGGAVSTGKAAGAGDGRAEALKYLVHLVADLHQPLHCGYKDDAGGNRIRVSFGATDTNLHALWDTHLVAFAQQSAAPRGLGENEYVTARLLPKIGGQITQAMRAGDREKALALLARLNPARARNTTIEGWAFESYGLARAITADACGKVASAPTPQKGKPVGRLKARPRGLLLTSAQSGATATDCAERSAARPIQLGAGYFPAHEKELDEQLLWAGLRLALMLNDIFK